MHAACCVYCMSADSGMGLQSSVKTDSREHVGLCLGGSSVYRNSIAAAPSAGLALLEATGGYFLASLCAL